MLEKIKNLTALGVANIVTTAISGLFWIFIASLVEVDKYGEIGYTLSIATLIAGISLLGAKSSLTVFAAKKESIIRPLSLFTISIGILILMTTHKRTILFWISSSFNEFLIINLLFYYYCIKINL